MRSLLLPQNKGRSHRARPLQSRDPDISGGRNSANKSERVIHVEFDRVRGHLEALDFGHLQLDKTVDEVVVEHAAVLEEAAVLVEILQRLAKRAAYRRD